MNNANGDCPLTFGPALTEKDGHCDTPKGARTIPPEKLPLPSVGRKQRSNLAHKGQLKARSLGVPWETARPVYSY